LTASAAEQDALLDLFDELLALNEPERAQRLALLDADTAAMLRAMLAADARAGIALPEVPFASLAGSWEGLEPGQVLGSFELLRLVGRGGMGQVYLGRRLGDVQQLAAIKVQLPLVATDETLRRFRLERQMLAGLEHPAIARLIECGEDAQGRPYYAMEWIDGVSIDRYCDDNRLDIKARLQLFVQLCDGVDYAHRHLVVHRDIKTSNIMVTTEGQPKLLDFGIAKALDTPTAAMESTATQARFFSPHHAAPEQVRGGAITIGCDVYALGVLLYQLLSGLRPYELEGLSPREVEERICEWAPPAASERLTALQRSDRNAADGLAQQRGNARSGALIQALRGDLDRIVLHALRKRPEERYASTAELRADIQRYLAGEAVLARGMGRGYRMRKFVGRHRVATFLAAGFVIALSVFTLLLWFQAGALRKQRDEVARQLHRVEVEKARAEQVTSFIEQTFAQADPNNALGEKLTVSEVLETGARTLDFAQFDDPVLRHRMQMALARVMQSLGRDGDAARLMERIDPGLPAAQRAEAMSVRAQSLAFSGAIDEALRLDSEVLKLIEGRTDIPKADLGAIWLARGRVLRAGEQMVLARAAAEQALQLIDADSHFVHYAQALRLRARVLLQLNESQTARSQLHELLKLQQARLPQHHPALLDTLGLLSNELVFAGEFGAASALIEQRLESAEKVFGSDSLQLAFALNGRALLRTDQGDFDGAGADYDDCLDILRLRLSPNHSILSLVVLNSGELELLRGAAVRAEARYREALAMTSDKDRGVTNTGFLRLGLGGALSDQGKFEPAQREIEAALNATPAMQGLLFALATAEKAVWLKRQGRNDEAQRLWHQAQPILDRETSAKYGPRLRLERAMRPLASS
jgi:eukaryotic-like serine/threonine-protein kinase